MASESTRIDRSSIGSTHPSGKMSQPNMLYYGSNTPQYPIVLDSNQRLGDFVIESRNFRCDQNRTKLERHLDHRGNSGRSHPAPHSHFRDAGLSQGERHHISQVQNATRAALGPSFDFDEESRHRSQIHANTYQRSRGWMDSTDYKVNDVPQKYIDEFNQKWHEDDEDNDADQFLADYAKEAIWRDHAPINYSIPVAEFSSYGVPSSNSSRSKTRTRATKNPMKRMDSGYASMISHRNHNTPERKEASSYQSAQSQRPQTSHRSKRTENAHRHEQLQRPYTSHRAGRTSRQQDNERPRTPIPGLASTFSWDTNEEATKKRHGGFFGGLFRRY